MNPLSTQIVILLAAVALAVPANSQVPTPVTLTYQGQLSDAAGHPINEARAISFKLYSQSEDGEAVWEDDWNYLNATDGRCGEYSLHD